MALKLFKLAIDATSDIDTVINPDIKQYFYEFDSDDIDEDDLIIPAGKFVDDSGTQPTTITTITENNGYYLLFVNGVLQQSEIYEVAGDGTAVTIEDIEEITEEPIPENAPITLIVTNFAPTSDSDINIIT